MNDHEADELASVFLQFSAGVDTRLERGEELAGEVAKTIQSGKSSQDERVKWTRETMDLMVQLLTHRADNFNLSQTDQLVQPKDLIDVLNWTAALLKKRLARKK